MATSKLQSMVGNLLSNSFPEFSIQENYRPDWLISSNHTRLELDFFIEALDIAFEVQGLQHFEYIPFFYKSYDDFEKRTKYDKEKKDLCYGKSIKLYEIIVFQDAKLIVENIKNSLSVEKQEYAISSYSFRELLEYQRANIHFHQIYRFWRSQVKHYELIEKEQGCKLSGEVKRFYSKLYHHYYRGDNIKGKMFTFYFSALDEMASQKLIDITNKERAELILEISSIQSDTIAMTAQ